MGCEDFLVHGRVSMLLFCLTYALFFNKIGYLCRGGSLSPSYTRILALQLYSLFFPILTSRIVYLSSSNSGLTIGGILLVNPFKVLGVLFLEEVCSAFLPSKKACWAHQFRYLGVDQQYPGDNLTRRRSMWLFVSFLRTNPLPLSALPML